MSLLGGLKTEEDVQGEKDSLGGGGVLDSNIYPTRVDLAYVDKSKGGALALNLHLVTPDGKNHRETLWIASGDAKGNKPYYQDQQGNKKFLPGYIVADSLAQITLNKSIADLDTEEKTVKLHDWEAKKELPKKVQVITELLGQEVYAGIVKETVDKKVNDGNGNYVATGETRDQNVIDKFFSAENKLTLPEMKAKEESPVFFDKWLEKNKDQTRDRTDKDAPKSAGPGKTTSGGTGAANTGGESKAPSKSLFT